MRPWLYLLRHAHAGSGQGDDSARELTPLGEATARAVGAAMLERGHRPDRVFVSTATRTRTTAALVLAAFDDPPPVQFEDELYLASSGRLREWALGERDESWMIVAHNPGIGELAAALAGPAGRIGSYPPGALTAFGRDGERLRFIGAWPGASR